MFVAFVAKTIFKSKNGVLTCFVTATKLRQPNKACRKSFFEMPLLRALGRLHKKKATADAVTKFDIFRYENYFLTSLVPLIL